MMRVRMLTGMAGIDFAYRVGEEVEMSDQVAIRLLATNQAEHILPPNAGGSSKDWPLGISPADYLRRFPAGPNADAARRLVEVR